MKQRTIETGERSLELLIIFAAQSKTLYEKKNRIFFSVLLLSKEAENVVHITVVLIQLKCFILFLLSNYALENEMLGKHKINV